MGFLHRDQRRVNVLLSRAKHKLVFVGSAATLSCRHRPGSDDDEDEYEREGEDEVGGGDKDSEEARNEEDEDYGSSSSSSSSSSSAKQPTQQQDRRGRPGRRLRKKPRDIMTRLMRELMREDLINGLRSKVHPLPPGALASLQW